MGFPYLLQKYEYEVVFTVGFAETTSSFNGVFFAIFQFSGFAGTLISGIIKHFTDNNTVLFIILTIVGVVSVFSLSFLPNVESYSAPGQEEKNDAVSFNETFRLLCSSVKLLMILPLIIYNGMSLAFIFGDIPTGISNRCFGGSWNLYTTAIFYLANAFCEPVQPSSPRSLVHLRQVRGEEMDVPNGDVSGSLPLPGGLLLLHHLLPHPRQDHQPC